MRSLERGLECLSTLIDPITVVDIGVANGTPELYKSFPHEYHSYVLVEADPRNYEKLDALSSRMSARGVKAFCGERAGSVMLKSAIHNTEFSSAYEFSTLDIPTNEVAVPVRTLDSIMEGNKGPILLKIDVEGAELEVLKGGTETLKNAQAVILEASIAKRLKDAPEFGDIVCFMKERCPSVFDLLAGSNLNGKLHQIDIVFVKTDSPLREVAR